MKASPQLRPRLKREIDAITDKILRELGYPEPPLKLEDVRELLKLDLAYFSTEQDGFERHQRTWLFLITGCLLSP